MDFLLFFSQPNGLYNQYYLLRKIFHKNLIFPPDNVLINSRLETYIRPNPKDLSLCVYQLETNRIKIVDSLEDYIIMNFECYTKFQVSRSLKEISRLD